MGGSALGSRKETPFETGKRAGNEIAHSVNARACIDQYVQDQLIVFMALAAGKSRIRTVSPITLHTKTGIYIAELLTDVSEISRRNQWKCKMSYLLKFNNLHLATGQVQHNWRWNNVYNWMWWHRPDEFFLISKSNIENVFRIETNRKSNCIQ